MTRIKHLLHFGLCAVIAASSATTFAQTGHPQTWAQDIATMESLPPDEAAAQQSAILQMHAEVELWIKAHPGSSIQLSPLPSLPLKAEQATAQLAELQKAVAAVVQLDPTHPFHLAIR